MSIYNSTNKTVAVLSDVHREIEDNYSGLINQIQVRDSEIKKLKEQVAKLTKKVNCSYEHKFHILGNICMKCGWTQPGIHNDT